MVTKSDTVREGIMYEMRLRDCSLKEVMPADVRNYCQSKEVIVTRSLVSQIKNKMIQEKNQNRMRHNQLNNSMSLISPENLTKTSVFIKKQKIDSRSLLDWAKNFRNTREIINTIEALMKLEKIEKESTTEVSG